MRATIENLEHLLQGHGISVRFNVIKKQIELWRRDGSKASENEVVSLCLLYGIGTNHVPAFLEEIARRQPLNPVRDWIMSKPWDGVDRLPAFYGTVIAREDYSEDMKCRLLYRWLLSAVAAALKETGFKARGVLTLQGPQGAGKTSWVAALMPPSLSEEFIRRDHHLDPANKDSVYIGVSHWITEIGELDSSFRKDIARLKGFLTNDSDKIRLPYGRKVSEFPRRTVFAATVNDDHFLVDATGNSRWWTIPVAKLAYGHEIDMQQLFAQLAVDFDKGEQWWLTPEEEKALADHNLQHRSISAIAEQIHDLIDMDRLGLDSGKYMTAVELLKELSIRNPSNSQCRECGAVLRELIGQPKRVQGRARWRVPLITDQPKSYTRKAVEGPPLDPADIF